MLNLDCMSKDDLLSLFGEIDNHVRLSAKKYNISIPDIKIIKAYAINKKIAMDLRESGDIQEALKYEAICERLYNNLSDINKW